MVCKTCQTTNKLGSMEADLGRCMSTASNAALCDRLGQGESSEHTSVGVDEDESQGHGSEYPAAPPASGVYCGELPSDDRRGHDRT